MLQGYCTLALIRMLFAVFFTRIATRVEAIALRSFFHNCLDHLEAG